MRPETSSSTSASSSTISPRAVLTRHAPSRSSESRRASSSPSRLRRQRRVDRDDVGLARAARRAPPHRSGSASRARAARILPHAARRRCRSGRARRCRASSRVSSSARKPSAHGAVHSPARTRRSPSTTRRRAARISAQVRSAVAASSTPGVFVTATPRAGERLDADPVVADAEVRDEPQRGKRRAVHRLVRDDAAPRRRRVARARRSRRRPARRTPGRDTAASREPSRGECPMPKRILMRATACGTSPRGRPRADRRRLPPRGRSLAYDHDPLLQRGSGVHVGGRHGGVRLELERRARAVPEELAAQRGCAPRDPLVQGRRRSARPSLQRADRRAPRSGSRADRIAT